LSSGSGGGANPSGELANAAFMNLKRKMKNNEK
jgi:hypothetical protein